MDLSTLVPTLVTFLTPFLPYLLKGGDKAAEAAGSKFGAAAWERAQALWSKLHPTVTASAPVQAAVHDAATTPDDADAQAALRYQLKKLLAAEPSLAAELAQQFAEAHAAGVAVTVSGDRAVGVAGSVSGSTIVTGDHTTTT